MKKNFSHLSETGDPTMVDVGEKKITRREAVARSILVMDAEIIDRLENDEIHTKKGPVFQTAILAGIMATKRTSELIPLCHPIPLDKSAINIHINEDKEIIIDCTCIIHSKTGVEMEALTGASVAALTIYDMCKGFSHNILIKETKLMKKTGGKNDYERA